MVKNNVDSVKTKKKLVVCPECGSALKSENYSRHMERVHKVINGGNACDFHYGAIIAVSVVLVLAISGLWLYGSVGKTPNQQENIAFPRITNTATPTITNSITSTISNTVTPPTSTSGSTVASSNQGRIHDGVMEIPISEVGTSARWYTYISNGVNVKFFVVKGSDGKIHLAADACDVCYRSKRGYRQTSAVMTCNNCGQTFAINSIGTGNTSGGCWPSYIPMKIEDNNVIIKTSDLDGKRSMFA
jgi:uncharacterized membrane protein